MSIPANQLILLDTNILVNVVRNNATGQRIIHDYSLSTRTERPLFSTVTEGEILGLARGWKWGPTKLAALQELLDQLVRIESGFPDIVTAYSELYAAASATGKQKGENDLWIAATAKVARAVLLTTDKDFDWMDEAGLVAVERVDP